MVFGANTFRQFVEMLGTSDDESEVRDSWVTLFPVITGQTGGDLIFRGAADFDLELIDSGAHPRRC